MMFREKERKNKWRLHAQTLFLTYSRCPKDWTKEFVRDKLVNEILVHRRGEKKYKTKVRAYVVAEEKHKDKVGEGEYERGDKHFHCLLELDNKTDIKQVSYLDIQDGETHIVHGNYQAIKNIWNVLNYVKKYGDWIGEGFPGMKNENRAILEASERDAKMILMDKMSVPAKLAFKLEIEAQAATAKEVREMLEGLPKFAIHDLIKSNRDNERRIKIDGRDNALFLYGPPATGKSSTMYVIADELIKKGMIPRMVSVRSFEDLTAAVKGKEQIICIEEVTKELFEREEFQRELTDLITNRMYRTQRYHSSKELAWPRYVILTTNENVEEFGIKEALRSRMLFVKTFKGRSSFELKRIMENGEWRNLEDEEIQNLFQLKIKDI